MNHLRPDHLAVVSLHSADIPAMVHFYRDVVGLTLLPHHGHRPAFELGNGCFLVLVQGEPLTSRNISTSSFPALAFAVEDIEQVYQQLKESGVEMPWGIEENGKERWIRFTDPSGNLIEFAQFG